MKKKIALSIEQMNYLESLGLGTSDASMCWYPDNNPDFPDNPIYGLTSAEQIGINYPGRIPSYTLQDILDVIEKDKTVRYVLSATDIEIYLMGTATKIYTSFDGNNPLDYAYDALVQCIRNGYIKTNVKR